MNQSIHRSSRAHVIRVEKEVARASGIEAWSPPVYRGSPSFSVYVCVCVCACVRRVCVLASIDFTVLLCLPPGNDFFGALGNIFACHAVDNPDLGAELLMLAQYGPRVDPSVLRRLALAFDELRRLNTEGVLAYPYSMRELVHLVTHLNTFPHEVRMLGPRGAGQFVTGTCACVACARVRDCE